MSKPSEKAMQCVYNIRQQVYTPLTVFLDEVKAAELIDAHTAEALAEHQRVIEMAEKALTGLVKHIGTLRASKPEKTAAYLQADATLAEIAKLRKE